MTASLKRTEIQRWNQQFEVHNSQAKNSGFKFDWMHRASLVLFRVPICTSEPPEWQVEYDEWKKAWNAPLASQVPDPIPLIDDLDNPLAPREKSLAEREITPDLSEAEKFAINRAKQIQLAKDELMKPGPRITNADIKYDTKSLMRKIDDFLVLLVKRRRDKHEWQFPQVPLPLNYKSTDGPLRIVISNLMKTKVGNNLDFYIPGNCPSGCYAYPYPTTLQESRNAYGSKVFFYRGYYCEGQVDICKDYADYAWVNVEELEKLIQDQSLCRYMVDVMRVMKR